MKEELNDILVCPKCKNYPLELEVFDERNDEINNGELKCIRCGSVYSIIDGIPRMIPYKLSKKWEDMQKKYIQEMKESWCLAKGSKTQKRVRKNLANFMDFANIKVGGKLLDIGCGSGLISELLNNTTEYYGIDPFIRDGCHLFPFVVAYAEYFPFQDEIFDYATVTSVLDHVENPTKVILEIHRVLKAEGTLYVSQPIQELQKFRSKIKAAFNLMQNEGLDTFLKEFLDYLKRRRVKAEHLRHYTEETLLAEFDPALFKVSDKRLIVEEANIYISFKKVDEHFIK